MVVVPAGSFMTGSPDDEPGRDGNEGPQRPVTIARPFAVGKFEVTRGEFAAFLASGFKPGNLCWSWLAAQRQRSDWWAQLLGRNWQWTGFAQTDRHPVVCVEWQEADAYAAWLARLTGKTYRLP
jgi:formylglycine-generating enzyme required for sulfatase activity